MNNQLLVPTKEEMMSYQVIAQTAANTPYWQKMGGMQAILSVMLLARELGISPMNAITGMFNVIQGKVEISGKGMNYLIRRAGHKLKLIMLTNEKCILKGIRADTGEEMETTFTIQDAQNAGLVQKGGAWVKTPKDMLFWRALSQLARRLFTDCLGGCYVEGELQETVEKKPVLVSESIPVEQLEIEETKLDLPSDISQEEVELYLIYLVETYQRPKQEFIEQAKKRPESFFIKLREFLDKEISPQEMQLSEVKPQEIEA